MRKSLPLSVVMESSLSPKFHLTAMLPSSSAKLGPVCFSAEQRMRQR